MDKSIRTMMRKLIILLFIAILPCNVYAGTWVDGYGSSVKDAIQDAISNARAAVNTRGRGCVGGAKGGENVRLVESEAGSNIFRAQAFYSNHNGSCSSRDDLNYKLIESRIKVLEQEVSKKVNPPIQKQPHNPKLVESLKQKFNDSYKVPIMKVGHPEVVSISLDEETIKSSTRNLFNGDNQAFIKAELIGARLFTIDESDIPSRKLSGQAELSWEWIVEPEAEGDALPLVLRVHAFTGSIDKPENKILVTKVIKRVEAKKSAFDKFSDWLGSVAGIVTSLGVILGGILAVIGFFKRREHKIVSASA